MVAPTPYTLRFHVISIFRGRSAVAHSDNRRSGDGRGARLSFKAVLQPSRHAGESEPKAAAFVSYGIVIGAGPQFCWLSSMFRSSFSSDQHCCEQGTGDG